MCHERGRRPLECRVGPCPTPKKGSRPPSDCSLRSGSPGEPRAPAAAERKLGGNISAESGLTPRRSFSRNIFRQDGERLKDLALS